MSRTLNTRIEQNIHLPPKSYSPWSLVSSTIGLTQNFHRTVLLCWQGWDISLILIPFSCETHRQFDYNLSSTTDGLRTADYDFVLGLENNGTIVVTFSFAW